MERLTKKDFNFTTDFIKRNIDSWSIAQCLKKLQEYENFEEIFREKMTDTACDFLSDKEEFGKWLDRNRWIAKKCDEWVRAEEQGLLLRLPCNVGDTVYWIDGFGNIRQSVVNDMFIEQGFPDIQIETLISNFSASEIGKTVFLTKEEAEQKLKEMERD